jgi:membrane-bound lytic murein transglycosylase B
LTIVQYNRSYFYAESVAEFAEALGYRNQSVVPIENIPKVKDSKTVVDQTKTKKSATKKKPSQTSKT